MKKKKITFSYTKYQDNDVIRPIKLPTVFKLQKTSSMPLPQSILLIIIGDRITFIP